MQWIERIRKERKGKKARLNKEMQGDREGQMRIKVSGTEEREREIQGNRVEGNDNGKI